MIVITAFFAPPGQTIRKRNFLAFRKHLGIPLIVVEWSREGIFHIEPDECDHLIRLTTGDLLWQKEAMLNVGIREARRLGYSKAALLDADIIFLDPQWHEKVSDALDLYDVIQCFNEVSYLPELASPINFSRHDFGEVRPLYKVPSLVKSIEHGQRRMCADAGNFGEKANYPGTNLLGNPGLAHAVNLERSSIELYPNNIVGGGDLVLIAASHGLLNELFSKRPFFISHAENIKSWALQYGIGAKKMGYTECPVAHLWHGSSESRNYINRYSILSDNEYDPAIDIRVNSENLLEFTQVGARLLHSVGNYLESRKDG